MKQLEKRGVVYGWGYGPDCEPKMPQEITMFGTVTDVFAGDECQSFVVKDTKLYQGHIKDQLSTWNLPPIKSFASVHHACFAIDTSGKLWSWQTQAKMFDGRPRFDHESKLLLGRGSASKDGRFTPKLVAALSGYKIKQVVCSAYFTVCLTTDGEVFIWGHCFGESIVIELNKLPQKVEIEKIAQVACGFQHVVMLSVDRKTVWSFGCNAGGQLGQDQLEYSLKPVKIPFLGEKELIKVQAGEGFSAVLTKDGKIIRWGSLLSTFDRIEPKNNFDIAYGRAPQVVDMKNKVVDFCTGMEFMLILTDENRLYAFGSDLHGECGQALPEDIDEWYNEHWFVEQPTEVRGLQNLRIKQISAARSHCLVKCAEI